jgi:hypothetical protein
MAAPTEYPLINGKRYSFCSIEAVFATTSPIPIIGLKSLNYSESLEPGEVYGTRPQLLGYTRGKQKPTADAEFYRLEFDAFRLTLGAAGIGFGEAVFDIPVMWAELGAPVVTDVIVGARITKVESSNSDGTDASTIKVTFAPLRVNFGGTPIAVPALPLGF